MRYYTNNDFLFKNLYLSNPYELQGGKSYLSKIRIFLISKRIKKYIKNYITI